MSRSETIQKKKNTRKSHDGFRDELSIYIYIYIRIRRPGVRAAGVREGGRGQLRPSAGAADAYVIIYYSIVA